jgi:hypothetical protein
MLPAKYERRYQLEESGEDGTITLKWPLLCKRPTSYKMLQKIQDLKQSLVNPLINSEAPIEVKNFLNN